MNHEQHQPVYVDLPAPLFNGEAVGTWLPVGVADLEAKTRPDEAGSFYVRVHGSPDWAHVVEHGQAVPIPGSPYAVYTEWAWPVGRIELRPRLAPA